jgi:peroxiredoxin
MPAIEDSQLAPGAAAPAFDLPATDGKRHTLASVRGTQGLLVVFICNHCPYVQAAIDKIVRDSDELKGHGVGTIAISSNDAKLYPEDSFANMKTFARKHELPFPYAYDESQDVARAYGAVCTPDFFGFDRNLKLAYRGRLDGSGRSSDPDAPRELFEAMLDVALHGRTSREQRPSIGCSIKWRRE